MRTVVNGGNIKVFMTELSRYTLKNDNKNHENSLFW